MLPGKRRASTSLVHTLERWYSLALGLVEGVADDPAVAQLDLAVGLLLEGQGVLHPVDIVTLRVVLTGVGTTGLLAVGGRGGGLGTVELCQYTLRIFESNLGGHHLRAGQKVPQLHGLDKVGVPDHAAVLDTDVLEHAIDLGDLANTRVQALLRPEHADLGLHGLLHGETDLGGALGAVRRPDLVEHLDGLGTGIGADGCVLGARGEVVADGVGDGTAENDQVEKGVGSETVGTVHGHASSLAAGKQTRNDLVVTALVDRENLTSVPRGNTTHVVVNSGQDGDGLLGNVDTGEDAGSLRDTGQTLVQDLRRQVAELQVDVVLVRADTTALADLHGHGTRDDVAGGKILGGRSVTLHETLTLRVQEVTTLTTGTLGDQAAGAVDTSGVELDELEILVGQASTGDHGRAISGTCVCRSAAEVCSTVSTSSQNRVLGQETVQSAIFLVVGQDTTALTILHDQIDDEVLDEVVGVVSQGLAVEGVQQSVTSSVSSSTASVGLATLAELLRLTTESSLVTVKSQRWCSECSSCTRQKAYIFPSSVRENGQP